MGQCSPLQFCSWLSRVPRSRPRRDSEPKNAERKRSFKPVTCVHTQTMAKPHHAVLALYALLTAALPLTATVREMWLGVPIDLAMTPNGTVGGVTVRAG